MHRATQIVLVLGLGTLATLLVTQDESRSSRADRPRWIFDHESRGILQGRVRVDAGVPASHVTVGLWFDAAEGGERYEVRLDDAGSFLFDPVPTGVARLTFWVESEADPLLELNELEVGAGRVDARLFKLDLTGRLSRYEIEIVDPLGEPVPDALVGWRPADEGAYAQTALARDGRATLVSSFPLIDLLVQARGLRTEEFPGVDADATLALREGLSVVIDAPPDARVAAGEPELELWLAREDLDPRFGPPTSDLAEYLSTTRPVPVVDGSARFALPAPGTWRLTWRLTFGVDQSVELGDAASPVRIEVVASFREQRFQPPFPLSDLRTVLAR